MTKQTKMRSKFVMSLLAVSWTAVAAALGNELPDDHARSAQDVVVVKNFAFAPATLHVRAGTTVTWKNADEEPHTVVSDSGAFRSTGMDEGDTFQVTFDKPGTYRFFCSVHPHMTGTIIVD
jgi:plastocyanin